MRVRGRCDHSSRRRRRRRGEAGRGSCTGLPGQEEDEEEDEEEDNGTSQVRNSEMKPTFRMCMNIYIYDTFVYIVLHYM